MITTPPAVPPPRMLLCCAALVLPAAALLCCSPGLRQRDRLSAPAPSTAAQRMLINEGVGLHDRGDFRAAIARYQAVLDENPDNVLARYELAYAQHASRQYTASAANCRLVLGYRSSLLPAAYALLGNNYDLLGDTAMALRTYRAGIARWPHDHLLHFNMGVTLARRGHDDGARECFKRAVAAGPGHPGSHYALADTYCRQGYRIPALLAYLRFLELEPVGRRSATALHRVDEILSSLAAPDTANPARVAVAAGQDPAGREGDFSSLALGLALARATRFSSPDSAVGERERTIGELGVFLSSLASMQRPRPRRGFAWRFYAPYFAAISRQGHGEAFLHYALQYSSIPGIGEWVIANVDRVQDFVAWSRSYAWPGRP